MLYTSMDNPKIKQIKKLSQKKYREKYKEFMVEGSHLVLEAFKKGYLKELILEKNELFPLQVVTHYVTNDIINYLSTLESPSNIIGICSKLNEVNNIGDRVLIIDNIQDPGNLGSIIRSAVAFNVDTVILSSNTVDLYNPKVVRATQGMLFHVDIKISNLLEILPVLKNKGYKVMGTRVTSGKSLKSIEKSKKFVIIVGNEGSGVNEDIVELCDEFIYIDMSPVCESLNVAVATSIILYELDK
ncbi:MAG: RNA methyltransferase [Bacilli bacterium]|nr:RNA methyltransferase [Bacilli bacterium]MDD4282445.1 RNA methyltransferase [Bacilli bacterium]MDD4718916.1 RNA methyltransferase [Bacilli bacterium]